MQDMLSSLHEFAFEWTKHATRLSRDIPMFLFTRESVDYFACCIRHCSTLFREDHAKKNVRGQICYS